MRAHRFVFTLRKRVFGGFAAVLVLLTLLAGVMQRGASAVDQGVDQVRDGSAAAEIATGIASRVSDAQLRTVQYALSGTVVDQEAARQSLTRLDEAIGANSDRRLTVSVAQYKQAVEAAITAVGVRRAAVAQWQQAGTEVRNIVTAISQSLERESDPDTIRAGAHLADAFQTSDAAASRFLSSRNPADIDIAAASLRTLRTHAERMAGLAADNRRVQRLLSGIADPVTHYAAGLQALVASEEQLRQAAVARDAATGPVQQEAAALGTQALTAQHEAVDTMATTSHATRRAGLFASVAAIAVGLLLAVLIGRAIATPVRQLTGAMQMLAKGALDTAIPHIARRDEIGDIARAVVVFRAHMQQESTLAAAQSAERRQAEVDKHAALIEMAETIGRETNTVLDQVGSKSGAMAETARQMSASAARTGQSADNAAAAATQAQATAQTVASAAEQLAASIREIGSQVAQSTAVVSRAVAAGGETRATIAALNQEVERIGTVAGMIADIAARTNLLALNATIEAARAGDAGKGFAVVASEVKALADQTRRSTEEITSHINQVRAATGASVAAVERIERTITEVDAIASAVAAAVEQQGAATAEIARSVTETAAAANNMASRTGEVSAEALETGSKAAQVRDNCDAMSNAVSDLKQTVEAVVRTSMERVERQADDGTAVARAA
jgi:methyl-accepting chemotaxis protein